MVSEYPPSTPKGVQLWVALQNWSSGWAATNTVILGHTMRTAEPANDVPFDPSDSMPFLFLVYFSTFSALLGWWGLQAGTRESFLGWGGLRKAEMLPLSGHGGACL
jgi:hypothetical protein